MKYIFLIAAFNALFFAVLLIQKKHKRLHDNILTYWLIYLGLFMATQVFLSSDLIIKKQLLSNILISMFMLHGPFLYMYITALTTKKYNLSKSDLLHFVPPAGFIVYLLFSFMFPQYSDRINMNHVSNDIEPPLPFVIFLILTALSGPVYFVLSVNLFRKLDINIFNNFSYSEDIDLDWLRKLVYIFGIVWSALMIIAIIHHVFKLYSMVFCTDGLFLSLSIFILLIGYFGLRQKEIFNNLNDERGDFIKDTPIKYVGLTLKEADIDYYIKKIKHHMINEKPYLISNLTLPQLAANLEIPSHHLSKVINENFENNFFDFINQYRIEEVKTKLADPKFKNFSLLGIALDSGFNSKSAFNRVFKKMTGLTPSKYKEMTL
ncbi:MAG: helix-turn-helix domain-containing protein [Flavobacteriaceae bacterium]|nr:helix-turn-helix domain-containing protein [Flavobacteriaceae bacterium]